MAPPKEALISHVFDVGSRARLIELSLDVPLDFVGGQYLIVDTGLTAADDRRIKRAYSIVSADADQAHVRLAVQRRGPGSTWLCERVVGEPVRFSGPWGKWLADDTSPRRTLILATDTGISAALGLVNGRAFAPQRRRAELLWLVERDDYFLPPDWVAAALPPELSFRRLPLLPVGHPERLPQALALLADCGHFDSVFLVGDGALLFPLREHRFDPATRLECFFNYPKKSA